MVVSVSFLVLLFGDAVGAGGAEQLGQRVDEVGKWPAARFAHPAEVDTLAALAQRLLGLIDEQFEILVLRLAGFGERGRFAVSSEFSLVAYGGAQILAGPRGRS